MSTKHVGILGGSFNPVHEVHIALGLTARDALALDEIWILIDKEPRNKKDVAKYEDRLHMVKTATEGYGFFVTDALEMQRSGRTHDHNSIIELKSKFPKNKFTMIVGLDTAASFPFWGKPEIFCENVDFAIVKRPPLEEQDLQNMLQKLGPLRDKFIHRIVDMPVNDLSSSFLRDQLKEGKPSWGIHPKVHKYILENRLYET